MNKKVNNFNLPIYKENAYGLSTRILFKETIPMQIKLIEDNW